MDTCPTCGAPTCPLCGHRHANSKHHLHPRSEWKLRTRGWQGTVVVICDKCHKRAHILATNEELAKKYASIKRLQKLFKADDWKKGDV
jgi:hypothetical protein